MNMLKLEYSRTEKPIDFIRLNDFYLEANVLFSVVRIYFYEFRKFLCNFVGNFWNIVSQSK